MRKFKFISCIVTVVIIISFFSSFSSVLAIDEPEVQANAFMLYEADSDTILYEKNADTKVYPASLTKITTVLLAIEAYESGSIS